MRLHRVSPPRVWRRVQLRKERQPRLSSGTQRGKETTRRHLQGTDTEVSNADGNHGRFQNQPSDSVITGQLFKAGSQSWPSFQEHQERQQGATVLKSHKLTKQEAPETPQLQTNRDDWSPTSPRPEQNNQTRTELSGGVYPQGGPKPRGPRDRQRCWRTRGRSPQDGRQGAVERCPPPGRPGHQRTRRQLTAQLPPPLPLCLLPLPCWHAAGS